jgi:hypothetical protein
MSDDYVPVEYTVKDHNGNKVRMVLQSDYAKLKSDFLKIQEILNEIAEISDEWEDK